jgi:hypothetical protein
MLGIMKKNTYNKKITFSQTLKVNSVIFFYNFLNVVLRGLKFLLFRKEKNPSRILIFRTGSLGDSLCAIPTIAGIRKKYKDATIDLLTNPGKSTLVSLELLISPEIFNDAINYYGLSVRQLASMLRKRKYAFFQADCSLRLGLVNGKNFIL